MGRVFKPFFGCSISELTNLFGVKTLNKKNDGKCNWSYGGRSINRNWSRWNDWRTWRTKYKACFSILQTGLWLVELFRINLKNLLRKEQQTEMAKRWNKLANDDLKKIKIINEAKRVSHYMVHEICHGAVSRWHTVTRLVTCLLSRDAVSNSLVLSNKVFFRPNLTIAIYLIMM